MDLQQQGRQANTLKNQSRLGKMLGPTTPAETGIYQGGFNIGSPYGSRYTVILDDKSSVQGEFITPTAPQPGSRVTAYKSAPGKYLFDCR